MRFLIDAGHLTRKSGCAAVALVCCVTACSADDVSLNYEETRITNGVTAITSVPCEDWALEAVAVDSKFLLFGCSGQSEDYIVVSRDGGYVAEFTPQGRGSIVGPFLLQQETRNLVFAFLEESPGGGGRGSTLASLFRKDLETGEELKVPISLPDGYVVGSAQLNPYDQCVAISIRDTRNAPLSYLAVPTSTITDLSFDHDLDFLSDSNIRYDGAPGVGLSRGASATCMRDSTGGIILLILERSEGYQSDRDLPYYSGRIFAVSIGADGRAEVAWEQTIRSVGTFRLNSQTGPSRAMASVDDYRKVRIFSADGSSEDYSAPLESKWISFSPAEMHGVYSTTVHEDELNAHYELGVAVCVQGTCKFESIPVHHRGRDAPFSGFQNGGASLHEIDVVDAVVENVPDFAQALGPEAWGRRTTFLVSAKEN